MRERKVRERKVRERKVRERKVRERKLRKEEQARERKAKDLLKEEGKFSCVRDESAVESESGGDAPGWVGSLESKKRDGV